MLRFFFLSGQAIFTPDRQVQKGLEIFGRDDRRLRHITRANFCYALHRLLSVLSVGSILPILDKFSQFFLCPAEICLMRSILVFIAIFLVNAGLSAGPEIFDPLEAWKRPGGPTKRPVTETVIAGDTTERARYQYKDNLLSRIDYTTLDNKDKKEFPAGYSLFEYDKGLLVHEQLFDAAGNLAEDIRYQYRNGRLEKSLIHDVRGNARIEWHYIYDKEGALSGGKRLLSGKPTESFKMVKTTTGWLQNIYNAKGELTAKVDSYYENGLLVKRVKTGLTGTRYADYRYNTEKLLLEIIYHDTIRGEKTLIKKHTFSYSLEKTSQHTAMSPP